MWLFQEFSLRLTQSPSVFQSIMQALKFLLLLLHHLLFLAAIQSDVVLQQIARGDAHFCSLHLHQTASQRCVGEHAGLQLRLFLLLLLLLFLLLLLLLLLLLFLFLFLLSSPWSSSPSLLPLLPAAAMARIIHPSAVFARILMTSIKMLKKKLDLLNRHVSDRVPKFPHTIFSPPPPPLPSILIFPLVSLSLSPCSFTVLVTRRSSSLKVQMWPRRCYGPAAKSICQERDG